MPQPINEHAILGSGIVSVYMEMSDVTWDSVLHDLMHFTDTSGNYEFETELATADFKGFAESFGLTPTRT